MDFDWQPEDLELKKRVADLFDPAAFSEMEALETADEAHLDELTRKFMKRLAGTGYFSLALGPEGRKETLTLMAAQEELARVSGSLFLSVETSVRLFGGLIAGYGGLDPKREILEPLKTGRVIGAVALSEPGSSEPQTGPGTTAAARRGGYIVSGRKGPVTNAPLADWLAVSGEVEDNPAFFLVRPGQAGVNHTGRLKTLGYNGLAVAGLDLAGVEVTKDRTLGPFDDQGPLKFLRQVQDLILSVASLGVIRRSHDAAHNHARSYHRGPRPIFAHQEVRFKLADTFTLYQTAQLLCYRAGWFYAAGQGEAEVIINCAKVFAAEASERAAGLAMQVLAGQGYVSGNVVERGYREAKYAALAGTTSELARMDIADGLLRRYPV